MNPKVKQLCSYIFPAVGSLFVTYLYNVMDGIFVGQGVGSAALGAVNIGVPGYHCHMQRGSNGIRGLKITFQQLTAV